MGGNPPLQRPNERQDRGAGARATRDYWFAQQLGERWQSDGTGIYRLVAEKEGVEAVRSSDRVSRPEPPRSPRNDVDDLIAELAGEVGDRRIRERDGQVRDGDDETAAWRRH